MIEKLKREPEIRSDGAILGVRTPDCSELTDKINELIDIIEELDDAVSATMDSVNIHEKQIDELQMKLEPEKCDIPDGDDAIQEVIHENLYTKSMRMDKEFAEEECVRLQNELDRTRKALDVAVDALKVYSNKSENWWYGYEFQGSYVDTAGETADKALEQINEIKGG